jgi:hypothetical protein
MGDMARSPRHNLDGDVGRKKAIELTGSVNLYAHRVLVARVAA